MKFLLEITPVDAEDVREEFLDGDLDEPEFTYRELEAEPDVVAAELDAIDVRSVEDPTLAHLLRAKHREMELQLEMLRARDSDGFLALSIELYGGVSPALRARHHRRVGAQGEDPQALPRDRQRAARVELSRLGRPDHAAGAS